ncbi:MAG: glycosyltransferase family 2 protein [Planctomycetota bacterium]|jgi:hypothetical protein
MGTTGLVVVLALLAIHVLVSLHFVRLWVRASNTAFRFQPEPLEDGPLVSVIVPARNEEGNLPLLAEKLLSQRYRSIEVFIVNDASTDRTGEIAAEIAGRDERVSVIEAEPLPPGWVGKNHACWEGARRASGEYLLFVDCDVRIENEETIGGLVAYVEREKSDLYSIIPRQQLSAFSERVFGPAIYAVMGLAFLPLEKVNDPADPKAAAVGQMMFFRASAYRELGGHETLKGHILEDVDFARLFKGKGRRTALHYAGGDVTVRMYTSLGEMWRGWGKNLYRAAAGGFGRFLAIEAALVAAYLLPPAVLLWSLASLVFSPTVPGAVAAVLAAVIVGRGHSLRIRKYRRMGWPLRFEPAHEAGVVFAMVLLAASAVREKKRGGLTWKGRSYTTAELQRGGEPPS